MEQLAAELQETGQRLQAAEQRLKQQTEGMAVAAHELRGPLMPILGVAALLSRTSVTAETTRLAALLDRQVRQLSRLIDDLADASRVATGTLWVERVPVDLVKLVGEALKACQASLGDRCPHFVAEFPAGPLWVHADEARLHQVFANLLQNACKYTPPDGCITLGWVQEPGVHAPGTVLVTIADSGVGISAAALHEIFEPFVQEPHAVKFSGQGLGVGLSIVRELVHAHGGEVLAISAGVGLGSQFRVRLPLMARRP